MVPSKAIDYTRRNGQWPASKIRIRLRSPKAAFGRRSTLDTGRSGAITRAGDPRGHALPTASFRQISV
jgi:hypothetical protein